MAPTDDLPAGRIRATSKLGKWSIAPDGGYYPAGLTIEVAGDPALPAIPYDMTIEVVVVHGEPICRSVEVRQCAGGPQVGRAALGTVPIDRIVREAFVSQAMRKAPDGSHFGPASPDERAALSAKLRPRRGRKGDPEAKQRLIEKVAAMYLDLAAAGERHPKPVIARELGYSQGHIGTLLAGAREQGLVGPPPGPGRAGSGSPSRPPA